MKRPDEISIYSQVSLNKELIDMRLSRMGFSFGKMGQVAKQYGIKVKKLANCYQYTAPKSRLQMFAEKLHFAGIPFFEQKI